MAFKNDFFNGRTWMGLAVGIGAAYIAPKVLPVLGQAAKPLTKAAMKSGIIFFEKGKVAAAELSETVEDLWAEAVAEAEEESSEEILKETAEAIEKAET
jgi:hypothetical protein